MSEHTTNPQGRETAATAAGSIVAAAPARCPHGRREPRFFAWGIVSLIVPTLQGDCRAKAYAAARGNSTREGISGREPNESALPPDRQGRGRGAEPPAGSGRAAESVKGATA